MRSMAVVFAALVILIAAAMTWQHLRYLHARRDIVQDRQPILYGAATFHVVTFLDTAEGSDVIEEVRRLRGVLESTPGAHLIYAGQAAFTRASSQLGPHSWDAVVLVQYPSREVYEATARSETHQRALAAFADSYAHGMQRACVPNLLIPQALLGLRVTDVLRGSWKAPPLETVPEPEQPELLAELRARQADLLRLRPVNDLALVVFNLTLPGTPEEQAADRSYGVKMVRRMAALAHGPMHMGKAVTLAGDARFENVVVVYYPGVSYFAKLLGSRFFQGIIGDKKLGDTQAVPTVPILSLL